MNGVHISITGPVTIRLADPTFEQTVLNLLAGLKAQGESIMQGLDEANAALSKINDATNAQAANLKTESEALQTISDNFDKLIASMATAPTPEAVAALTTKLQAQADAISAVGDSISAHADFAKAIASRGPATPVPVPVPPATPAPDAIP